MSITSTELHSSTWISACLNIGTVVESNWHVNWPSPVECQFCLCTAHTSEIDIDRVSKRALQRADTTWRVPQLNCNYLKVGALKLILFLKILLRGFFFKQYLCSQRLLNKIAWKLKHQKKNLFLNMPFLTLHITPSMHTFKHYKNLSGITYWETEAV